MDGERAMDIVVFTARTSRISLILIIIEVSETRVNYKLIYQFVFHLKIVFFNITF